MLQCVFAKDLVRRDILSDTVAPIVKTAQAVADKLSAAATEFINEFNATEQQVSKETDSIKTTVQQISVGIQDKIKAIFAEATQAGINVESCATGILAAVANVETQSGMLRHACFSTRLYVCSFMYLLISKPICFLFNCLCIQVEIFRVLTP